MTALYIIAEEYRAQAAKLQDLDLPPEVLADTLESLSGELEAKAVAVACMVRNLEATAAAIKAHEVQQKERREAIERRAASLADYLQKTLKACGLDNGLSTPEIQMGWRESKAVSIDDESMIPHKFMVQIEAPPAFPNKREIAAALKLGPVPGASTETRKHFWIK